MSVSLIDGHIDDDVMTDEQIVKALECCETGDDCKDCPYCVNERFTCGEHFNKDMIDLINRQKAEIERLKQDLHACVKEVSRSHEIDRHKGIKEFAERLTDEADLIKVNAFDSKWAISQEVIDNLVKEMVGEASG